VTGKVVIDEKHTVAVVELTSFPKEILNLELNRSEAPVEKSCCGCRASLRAVFATKFAGLSTGGIFLMQRSLRPLESFIYSVVRAAFEAGE
jgi:hypothetical protein